MNEFFMQSATAGLVLSLVGYFLGIEIQKRFRWAIFNPLIVAIGFVILFMQCFEIPYAAYVSSAKYLSYLLTPATVCLAVPLYQSRALLKKHAGVVLLSVLAGVLTSLTSVWILSKVFGLSTAQFATLLPKSITTAIGIGIAEELGGEVVLTTAVILLTGVFGNITAQALCQGAGIRHAVARGLAIGTSSHVIGTTKAMEMGEVEGAMSSLSIVLSGVLTVFLAPFFVQLL